MSGALRHLLACTILATLLLIIAWERSPIAQVHQHLRSFFKLGSPILDQTIDSVVEASPRAGVSDSGSITNFSLESAGPPISQPLDDKNTPPLPDASGTDYAIPQLAGCDFARGRWVKDDERRPHYSGTECKRWLVKKWACRRANRSSYEYEKYGWKPDQCDLPEFNGDAFLRRVRNKTIAFFGDSLGRQQFLSLMCMITGGKKSSDVKDRADRKGYHFIKTNTTILFHWTATVSYLEPSSEGFVAMHMDRPPKYLEANLGKFDVLILNTGQHWNTGKFKKNKWRAYVKGKRIGRNSNLRGMREAYNFTVHSVVQWLEERLKERKRGVEVFWRTESPKHFVGGGWDSGGRCDNTRLEEAAGKGRDAVAESAVRGKSRVRLLNITPMSEVRDEAHVSRSAARYARRANGSQDCLHWCLPGVPDAWNHLLFTHLLLAKF